MFRVVPLPIIMSTKLIYSIWYLSNCNEKSLKITNNVYMRVLKHGNLKTN